MKTSRTSNLNLPICNLWLLPLATLFDRMRLSDSTWSSCSLPVGLFTRLHELKCHNCLQVMRFRPPTIFVTLCWTLSSFSASLCNLRVQTWASSGCCLSCVEERMVVTSFCVLVTLLMYSVPRINHGKSALLSHCSCCLP